jgi:hypothetical protein
MQAQNPPLLRITSAGGGGLAATHAGAEFVNLPPSHTTYGPPTQASTYSRASPTNANLLMLLLDTFASLAQPPKTVPELGRIEQLRAMAMALPTSLGRLSCPPSVRSACSSSSPVGRRVCRSPLNERKADTDESTMNLTAKLHAEGLFTNVAERLSEKASVDRVRSDTWRATDTPQTSPTPNGRCWSRTSRSQIHEDARASTALARSLTQSFVS